MAQLISTPVRTRGFYLAGKWVQEGTPVEIRAPYDGSPLAEVIQGTREHAETAIEAAVRAFGSTRRLPAFERQRVLRSIAQQITSRKDEFARTIAQEAGKPLKAARTEVERAIFTFTVAAEETTRIPGEYLSLDWQQFTSGRWGIVRRFPIGPIAGITPFNFPLNLVAHKVAPAIAAGNPIVLRPASQTPVSSLKLGRLLIDAGWPADAIAVVPSSTDAARPLVEDDRIRLLTFTGSPAVGWGLKTRAGRKRVTLELGGNAAVIVAADADASYAAERVAWGGFGYAGQTCISVQRVYVHSSLYDAFVADLVGRVEALQVGDPLDEQTDVGPLIDSGAAERVEEWLAEAVEGGATVLAGGTHEGALWRPTVLADVDEEMRVACEEVFAPLVAVTPFDDVDEAIGAASQTQFGLQAGIFTNDMRVVEEAFDRIDVGGLMVNDVSTYRIDHMPYGGVRSSGSGREGLRYAIEEMTEMKLLTFNARPRG